MLQYLRSLIFVILIFALMPVVGLVFAPWALFSRRGARAACKTWCRIVLWLAVGMVGIRTQVRGPVPQGEVLIAAKHQSFLDIILIFNALPAAKFIMKREVQWMPVIGQYARMIGCVPIERGKRGQAIAQMVRDVEAGRQEPGQLIIYPQGTRVPPGQTMPYKVGTAVLYDQLSQPCVPVATNVGLFWAKSGVLRRPGTAVVTFLDPIEPGLERQDFMARLEAEIEATSDALMREGGFRRDEIH